MPRPRKTSLTNKYFTRVLAAMMIERRGYNQARKMYSPQIADFTADDLLEIEKMFLSFGTLHARGVARYIRELAARSKEAAAV